MSFGERLKELRLKDGSTQLQLAKILDISKSNVSKYESNCIEPNLDIVVKIAMHFGVSSDYLLGLSDKYYNKDDLEWRFSKVSNRLGNILSTYRQKENLSKAEFAQRLKINQELYDNIEIGKYEPTFELLKRIAAETQYDIDYLTGASDHTSVPSNEKFELLGKRSSVLIFEGNSHFKARFEELCLQNSINQDNAEKHLGLDKQTYIDIRWNRMPTLSELLKISYAFGVSLDYLIGKTDIKLSTLKGDELELILNYRDCLENFKKSIFDRAKELSLESLHEKEAAVAAETPLKKTGTDNLGK